jgi:ribosomal protein S12 methylthiotransferase
VKELLVISQDTSAYGVDLKYRTGFWGGRPMKTSFTDLARALGTLDVWVRLHYVYPYPHVEEVIPLMAEGKLLPYLDIPFQHASPALLKAMKRPARSDNTLQQIRRWREICPDITLRSTFIVGFPGETDSDFQYLLDFLYEAQLDRVGCFPYSPVEGAAANELPNQIPEDIKQARLETFMNLQAQISAEKLRKRIGQRMSVIVDGCTEDYIVARSQADAPDIDGVVYVDDDIEAESGEFINVEVTDADEHDLYARPVFGQE